MCVERSHNFDDRLSRRPPGLGVGECITHLVEPKDLIHQRSDGAAFHQPRDFSQLFSIGMHEKVLITGLVFPRCSLGFSCNGCNEIRLGHAGRQRELPRLCSPSGRVQFGDEVLHQHETRRLKHGWRYSPPHKEAAIGSDVVEVLAVYPGGRPNGKDLLRDLE